VTLASEDTTLIFCSIMLCTELEGHRALRWQMMTRLAASDCISSIQHQPIILKQQFSHNQPSPRTQPLQLKQTQFSQHPIIQNTAPPHPSKPRRSLNNLNQHRMIDIKNPPIRTTNQSPSFTIRTTAYESVPAALSTNGPILTVLFVRTGPRLFTCP
jgi:hypothetical protein